MRYAILVVAGMTLFATAARVQTRPGTTADEAAIRKIREAKNDAYNRHDAKAIANLYATDGDRVSNTGSYYAGRAQIEASYNDVFRDVSKNATVKDESSKLRFLTANVALVDVDAVISGRAGGTVKNHTVSIYVKRNGEWVFVAERATRIQ